MPRKDGRTDIGPKKVADRRTRRGKKTVKKSATSPKSIKFRRQVAEALEYRILGYTYKQIGAEMGFDESYAFRLVDWGMKETVQEPADRLRAVMRTRLEGMMSGVMDKAIAGDGEAQNQARANMELQAKLDGLFVTKIEHSGEVATSGTVVVQISADDAKL